MGKKQKRISPKDYSDTLKKIELTNLSLDSSTVKLNREEVANIGLVAKISDRVSYKQDNDELIVHHRYTLTVIREDKQQDKKHFFFKISATFCLFFSANVTVNDDFFDIFKQKNIPVNTWPYFREFVQNTTQRMNIPPVTLPFRRF